MDIERVVKINEKILDKSLDKVERAIINNDWDCECFEAMSYAINNIKDLMKYERKVIETDTVVEGTPNKKYDKKADDTEFMQEVNALMERKGAENGHKALFIVLCELMEDLKVIHTKMYDNTMRKLKEVH